MPSDSKLTETDTKKNTLRLWLNLLRTTKHIEKQLDKELQKRFNCTLARFDLLAVLNRHGQEGVLMKDLGKMLKVTNGNITGLIKKLEEKGYVQSLKKRDNNKNIYVFIRKEGLEFFEQVADYHAEILNQHLSFVSDEDVQLLISKLKLIHSKY